MSSSSISSSDSALNACSSSHPKIIAVPPSSPIMDIEQPQIDLNDLKNSPQKLNQPQKSPSPAPPDPSPSFSMEGSPSYFEDFW